MTLVSSFLKLVQELAFVMTVPTFGTFATVLTGWVFARRHTATGAILAADAVGTKHHSALRQDVAAEMVLTWYAMRWSIEVAFQSSKTHLGFEEPQGWTRRAVERTAPTAMLLHTLIVLWFARCGYRHDHPPNRPWYRAKRHASSADMLVTLKCESLREQVLSTPLHGRGSRQLTQTLLHAAQQAA